MDLPNDDMVDGTPTLRGIALASVSLGFFGSMVFWWYPFGMMLCTVGLVLGLFGLVMNLRVGLDGHRLPAVGAALSASGLTVALLVWRGMQILVGGY